MGSKTLVYKQKVEDNLKESNLHLLRLQNAVDRLSKNYTFPLNSDSFKVVLESIEMLAYCDQVIYRFSKLQDCMGAKLFKSVLLYEGENVNKPFLDLLNRLEVLDIINVDEWFEIRDLRNDIAHDYANNNENSIKLLNTIYNLRSELTDILESIRVLISSR